MADITIIDSTISAAKRDLAALREGDKNIVHSKTIGNMIDKHKEYLPDSGHSLIFEMESYGKLTIMDTETGKPILTKLVSDEDASILLLSYLVGLLSSTDDNGRERIKQLAEEFILLIGISKPTIVWSAPHSSPSFYDVFYATPEGELIHKEMHETELLHAELVQELHNSDASEDVFELLNELVSAYSVVGDK